MWLRSRTPSRTSRVSTPRFKWLHCQVKILRQTNTATARGLDGDLIRKDRFPLPKLGPKLDAIRRDLHDGKGFGLVRGLDPRKYGVEDLTMIQLGIQAYIANRNGRQDSLGNMLGKRWLAES